MDKNSKVQKLFELAEQLSNKKINTITVEENSEEEYEDADGVNLPTEYVTANGILVSMKDETLTSTNYLSKLTLDNDAYASLKFTKDEAKRIQNKLNRLTAGVISVVPLTCLGPNCAFASTCIAQGTKISIYGSNALYKKIEDIVIGDKVYSFNQKTKQIEKDIVTNHVYMGVKNVYKIITHTKQELVCTEDHPILTEVNDKLLFKNIKDGLAVNNKVFISDTDFIIDETVDSLGDLLVDYIETIQYVGKEEVYDITVKNNQNYFANDICVHNCPFVQENKAPVGKDCIIEQTQISYWMEKYITEFNLDESSITDLHMVSKLCEYDILEMRATKYLKQNDQTLLTDFVSSFDDEGNPITNKAVSAAFELKERIERLRSKTLKELMATREAKAKLIDTTVNKASASSLAAMKATLDNYLKERSLNTVNGTATRRD